MISFILDTLLEVAFLVASDDPAWCRRNLADPEGKLNILYTQDRLDGRKK